MCTRLISQYEEVNKHVCLRRSAFPMTSCVIIAFLEEVEPDSPVRNVYGIDRTLVYTIQESLCAHDHPYLRKI